MCKSYIVKSTLTVANKGWSSVIAKYYVNLLYHHIYPQY